MKKIILLVTALAVIGCSEKVDKNSMIVKGNIDGLKKGTVFLQQYEEGKMKNLDSVEVKGSGEFSFKTKLNAPEVFYIYLDLSEKGKKSEEMNYGNRLFFFGEPNKIITINSNHELFDVNAKIEGSESQKIYDEYSKNMRKFNHKNLELIEKQINALKENKVALSDSINKVSQKNTMRKYLYTLNFALTHPDSYVSPYIVLSDAPDAQVKFLDSVYKTLSPEVVNSKYGKELQKHIKEVKSEISDNQ